MSKAYDPQDSGQLKSEVGTYEKRSYVAHYESSPALGGTDDVLAAVTDDATEQTITTGITNPPECRNITALPGGTAGDIKAIQVTINGTDAAGEVLQEVLPVFTVNTATGVVGLKCFKTVTSIVIPAHDGTGATTEIGLGDKLGLQHCLTRNTVVNTFQADALEGTAPTVTVSATVLASNGATLNTALDGGDVDIYYFVDGDE